MELHGALPDRGAAKGEEGIAVGAAEAPAQHPAVVGQGQDDLRRPVIRADLNAETGGNQHLALAGVTKGFGAGVVLPVRDVQPEEPLRVG